MQVKVRGSKKSFGRPEGTGVRKLLRDTRQPTEAVVVASRSAGQALHRLLPIFSSTARRREAGVSVAHFLSFFLNFDFDCQTMVRRALSFTVPWASSGPLSASAASAVSVAVAKQGQTRERVGLHTPVRFVRFVRLSRKLHAHVVYLWTVHDV